MRVLLQVRGAELLIGQPEPTFGAPLSPAEPTFGDMDYDPKRDSFLFTRPPTGTNERREIALSLGWTSRLAAIMNERKETK